MQSSQLIRIKDAPVVWNCLNGIINVYKPAGISVKNIKSSILGNLCKGKQTVGRGRGGFIDELFCHSQFSFSRFKQSTDPATPRTGSHLRHTRRSIQSRSDNWLEWSRSGCWRTTSNRWLPVQHIPPVQVDVGRSMWVSQSIKSASTLTPQIPFSTFLVVGLNGGTRKIHRIRNNRLIRVYHVTGELGTSTENNFTDSMVIARANYSHVWPDKMTAVLSSMQASHQKKMFELCGVDIKSNAAFEIAKRGLIRPANSTLPVVYGIKCVQFDRPKFTVEVHAINEHAKYLGQLVQVCVTGDYVVLNSSPLTRFSTFSLSLQEIGLQLHSVAHCTGIRCIRHGHFSVEHSLLRGQWHLQEILSNMTECQKIMDEHPNILHQRNVELTEKW